MKIAICSLAGALLAAGCGGSATPAPATPEPAAAEPATAEPAAAADANAVFGPLTVGADYATYTKVSTAPFPSPTHGNRYVEVYVNDIGLAAYEGQGEMPAGSVVVKTSWERAADGSVSQIPGPIFIMARREAGFSAPHHDWYYAMHWADPPEKWRARLGGPVYWQSPSAKVNYCWGCHESYDRYLGMVPEKFRTWTQK
ncbi:MAG TPA: cytochrome P460 family protein [Kofleriaceae bacterium]|nr:cytochrome P460 family protein [Kofleriaceae bacterium]